MRNNGMAYAGIGIIAALAVLLAANSYLVHGYSGNQLTVQLTDPPQVPNGTGQLLVNYSGVQAHVKLANGSSEWISSSASGRVNLLSLINASTIIGSMQIPPYSMVNGIRLNVTDAEIEVNGTDYPVALPTNRISAIVHGEQEVNGSSSVLVDFTPTVITIDTNSSQIYLLVPSVKAVFVGNVAMHALNVPAGSSPLTEQEISSLGQTSPNVSITSHNITVSRNGTTVSVSINNTKNNTGQASDGHEHEHSNVVEVSNSGKNHLNLHINVIVNVQTHGYLNSTVTSTGTSNTTTSNTIPTTTNTTTSTGTNSTLGISTNTTGDLNTTTGIGTGTSNTTTSNTIPTTANTTTNVSVNTSTNTTTNGSTSIITTIIQIVVRIFKSI